MIPVCFRYDDPSPTSDHALEKNIIEILAEYEASATFAVIPFRSPKEEGGLIRWSADTARHLVDAADKGIIEIAQHGTTHVQISQTESGLPSEYFGQPFGWQLSRIQDGLAELETVFGKRIGGFVPPWNTYDENTAKATKEVGLAYLSPSLEIYQSGKLPIIPKTCNLLHAQAAIEEAERFGFLDPAVVIVLHPYQFEEFHKSPEPGERPPFTNLKKLGMLVQWILSREKARIITLDKLAERYGSRKSFWRFEDIAGFKYLPYRIKQHFPRKILMQGNKMKTLLAVAQKRNG